VFIVINTVSEHYVYYIRRPPYFAFPQRVCVR